MEFFNSLHENPIDSNHTPLMYANILGHRIDVDPEFVELVYFIVSKLHEEEDILPIFEWLLKTDAYLLDVIIMCWCIPVGCYSKRQRFRLHQRLIRDQLPKLLRLSNENVIEQFCIETAVKTCQLPAHCLDLIWPYLITSYQIVNSPIANDDMFTLDYDDDNLTITVDIDTILRLGLGRVPNLKGFTFEQEINAMRTL